MDIAQILNDAADLIEKGWSQRWYARTASGEVTTPHGNDAVCWCPQGAILRVIGPDVSLEAGKSASDHLKNFLGQDISVWNDRLPANSGILVAETMRQAAARLPSILSS